MSLFERDPTFEHSIFLTQSLLYYRHASSTSLVEAWSCGKWDKKAVSRLSVGVGDHDLTSDSRN